MMPRYLLELGEDHDRLKRSLYRGAHGEPQVKVRSDFFVELGTFVRDRPELAETWAAVLRDHMSKLETVFGVDRNRDRMTREHWSCAELALVILRAEVARWASSADEGVA